LARLFGNMQQLLSDAPETGLREPLLNPVPQLPDSFDDLVRVEAPIHTDKFPRANALSSLILALDLTDRAFYKLTIPVRTTGLGQPP